MKGEYFYRLTRLSLSVQSLWLEHDVVICQPVLGNAFSPISSSHFLRVTPGHGKEFRKTIFQPWKVMENSKGH